MAIPGVPSEFIITKPMYEAAKRGLGQASTCREKLMVFKNLGFEYPDIEQQLLEWQPRLEAICEQYTEQLANGKN